jgi:hypothetical protein
MLSPTPFPACFVGMVPPSVNAGLLTRIFPPAAKPMPDSRLRR